MDLPTFIKFAKSFQIIPNFVSEREARQLYGGQTIKNSTLKGDNFAGLVLICLKKSFDNNN